MVVRVGMASKAENPVARDDVRNGVDGGGLEGTAVVEKLLDKAVKKSVFFWCSISFSLISKTATRVATTRSERLPMLPRSVHPQNLTLSVFSYSSRRHSSFYKCYFPHLS